MNEDYEPEWLLPFECMRIGDSFFIPTLRPSMLIYIVDTAAKKSQVQVKTFITSREGYLGIRVWRMG
jgi:hypothetical protein